MGRPPNSDTPRAPSGGRFQIGAEVEVRSLDEGFRGAWFEATVIRTLTKYRRYTVQYSSLVCDETPTIPLEETIHYCYVRPRPPPISPDARFALHDLVDAFHNEGWWKGVVSKLPDEKTDFYTVCFPTTREEFEFSSSDLRPQLNWVKGSWIPVQDQGGPDVMFGVGTQVEVSRDREHYGASWFVGTVLKVIGKSSFLVEYEGLKVIDDGSSMMLLQEIVDLQYIRPSPPRAAAPENFDVLDEVEALYQDGWSSGVVTEILPGSRYIIKFRNQNELELDHAALRPLYDWTRAHWVRISPGECLKMPTPGGIKSAGRKRKSRAGKRSSLAFSVSTWSNGEVVDRSNVMNVSNRKVAGPNPEGQSKSSQPSKKLKKEKSLKVYLQSVDGMLLKYAARKRKMVGKSLPRLEENPALMGGLDRSRSPHERIAFSPEFGTNLPVNPLLGEYHHGEYMTGLDSTSRSIIREAESSNCMEERSEQQSKPSDLGHSAVGHDAADFLPIADWGNCKGARSQRENIKVRRKKHVRLAPHRKRKTSNAVHAQGETKKRKRGRPRKENIFHVNAMELRQPEKKTEPVVEREDQRNKVEQSNRALAIDVSRNALQACHHDVAANRETSPMIANIEGNSSANGVPGICRANMQINAIEVGYLTPQVESSLQLSKFINNSITQAMPNIISRSFNSRVEEIPCGINDNVEAEAEIESLPSPLKEDNAHGNSELTPSCSPSEPRALLDPLSSGLSSNSTALPFTKKSSIWESVELLEVFRTMPQHPHFHPLEQYGVEFREGMAIGLIVTFANLVADIKKLHIADSREIFEEKLKALVSLESNGFNVERVRSRLEKLLEIQQKFSQCESKRAALRGEIIEREDEKEQLDTLVTAHDKVIMELEDNLTHYRERRTSMLLERNSKEFEIVKLESDLQAAEQAYVSVEEHFNTAIAAPWSR